MKKYLLVLALCLGSTGAYAQCNGVFPANTLCGNLGASPAPPSAFSASGTVVGPGSSTIGDAATWANTGGTQLADGGTTLRIKLTGSTTFYVNKDQGSDSNNCLVTGAGACATSAHVMTLIANGYDIQGHIVTIQYQCSSYPCTYTQLPFTALQTTGGGIVNIIGDSTTPNNIVMNITSGGTGCVFCFSNTPGQWALHGFKISSSLGSGNGQGILAQGAGVYVTYGDMDFGALPGGAQVEGGFGAHTETDAANTITGNASYYLYSADGAVVHDTGATLTLTSTPTFSSAFIAGHGAGAIIGIVPSSITGPASGTSCTFDDGSLGDFDPISSLPGSGVCDIGVGSLVDGINGPSNYGGPETGGAGFAIFNGGTSGSVTLYAPAAAGSTNVQLPTITGVIRVNAQQTFSQLVTVPGTISYISDGKAANCGDSSCTTWGTTVTAGGGNLQLLVWLNGANWTLIGK
jgi:hypothetical protein